MHALWSQLRLNGLGDEDIDDFERALAAEPDRKAGRRIPAHTPLPGALLYREVVAFSVQLDRYVSTFGPGQVHVVVQEEMNADTTGILQGVYRWLDVAPHIEGDLPRVNTSKAVRSEGLRRVLRATPSGLKDAVPPTLRRALSQQLRRLNSRHIARTPIPSALRAQLAEEFAPEIARIEQRIGRRIPAWHVA